MAVSGYRVPPTFFRNHASVQSLPVLLTLTVAIDNINQASKYPKAGHIRRPSESKKVHYTCNPKDHGSASESCARGNTYVI
jgi:hypothetical protein